MTFFFNVVRINKTLLYIKINCWKWIVCYTYNVHCLQTTITSWNFSLLVLAILLLPSKFLELSIIVSDFLHRNGQNEFRRTVCITHNPEPIRFYVNAIIYLRLFVRSSDIYIFYQQCINFIFIQPITSYQ